MLEQMLAIAIAGCANVAIGFVWYHPRVFGSAWMKMANIAPERAPGTMKMVGHTFVGLVASIITAYVLLYFGMAWGVYDWATAIELGFWVWLGFQTPLVLGGVLWEMKPWKWLALNGAYYFLATITMSLIILNISGFITWN